MAIPGKTKVVAIVDDDDLMRAALQGLLKSAGLPTQAFASAEEFLGSARRCLPDHGYPHAGSIRPGITGEAEWRPLQDSDHLYNRTRRRENADAGDESRSNGLLGKTV
jgi:hypothetical protein